ncbi:MAG: FCD domain-containing protein [Acetobacterales bacterium]
MSEDRVQKTPDTGDPDAAIAFLRSQSLPEIVAREIERMIASGELSPGARVNENALAARLRVSRGPVREACRKLEQARLLEVIVNRGAFVRKLTFEEAFELHHIRQALNTAGLARLAAWIAPAQLEALEALVERMQAAAAAGDAEAYYPLNLDFHARTLSYSGWPRMTELYLGVEKELRLFRARFAVTSADLLRANADHREIVAALRKRDPEAAAGAAAAHWTRVRERWQQKASEAEAAEAAGAD